MTYKHFIRYKLLHTMHILPITKKKKKHIFTQEIGLETNY